MVAVAAVAVQADGRVRKATSNALRLRDSLQNYGVRW